jgi:hypothetical protein
LKDRYGSISSLASSTSLISPQVKDITFKWSYCTSENNSIL